MTATPQRFDRFLKLWILIWSAFVVPFDCAVAWSFYRQARAATFPTTVGAITRSDLKTTDSDDGRVYRLDVAYEYEIAGQRYTGTRYCYGEMGTNTKAWQKIRRELPVGSVVTVFYDRNDPAESLLRPGLIGFHLMMLWFLTPFNIIMIGGCVWLIGGRRPEFDPADSRCVRQTPTGWQINTPSTSSSAVLAAVLLGITFFGSFVWAIGWGFNPPVVLSGMAYIGAVLLAVIAAVKHRDRWLDVDQLARVLRFPIGEGQAEVPLGAVREVSVVHEEKKDCEGDVTHYYHCELIRADLVEGDSPTRIATYQQQADADAFATWFRERIGIVP